MGQQSLNDDEFVYAYLHDYLVDELSASDKQRYESLLQQKPKLKDAVDIGRDAFGKLQLAFQGYYLNEDQRVGLHEIVENKEIRKTREVEKIAEVGRWEAFGDFRRRLGMVAIVGAIVLGIIYLFTPADEPTFDALDALVYEALAMEQDYFEQEQVREAARLAREQNPEDFDEFDDIDPTDTRLALPTSDVDEIEVFFQANKNLDFQPKLIKKVPANWVVDGASVIDYDVAKITAVQYGNLQLNEKLFHFVFKGKFGDFPKAEPGNYQGLIYQTYSTDNINVVMWEQEAGIIGMLVGRRSAPEMAAFAKDGKA